MAKDIEDMLLKHRRLIDSEASKYASNLPAIVMKAEAHKLARKAAEDFDESKGNQYSTYLVNSLKKLSRLSTEYGAAVRIPENKQFKIQRLNTAEKDLEASFGRSPTVLELSEHTLMSIKEIDDLYKNRKNTVNVNNMLNNPTFYKDNDDYVHFVYHDLSSTDKLIFEHKIGFGGKAILSNEDLAKKLKIATSTLSNRILFIKQQLDRGMKLFGNG